MTPRPALRLRHLPAAIALLCGAALPPGALAAMPAADVPPLAELADLPLADLLRVEVRGASRYAQPLADAAATVTVLDGDELRTQGYRTLAEALASVRGVYVSNDRNYSYIGVRGFARPGDYNARVLLLTDGARRNDALFDQAQIGHDAPIELDWVKRLEFVSGPGSAIYGGNALFGVINAVMLDGGDVNGTRVSVDAGSAGSRRLGLVAGGRLPGEREWFVGAAVYDAQGRDLHFPEFAGEGHDGWVRGLDGEKYQKLHGKYREGPWRLSASFSSRDKAVPTAAFGTAFGEPGTRTLDQNALLDLAYDGERADGGRLQFRLYRGEFRYNGDYRYSGPLDNRDESRARWYGAEYRLSGRAGEAHEWMVGAEAQRNARLWQRNHDVAPAALLLDGDHPASSAGVFVQDSWRFHPRWLLNASLRYDRHSDYAGIASPRLALIHQPTPELTLKAMLDRAYRPPNAYERFYDDGGVLQKANPGLRPERVRAAELAAEFRLGARGRSGISVYRNEVRDLIEQVTDSDGLEVFTNRPRVRLEGVEVEAENRWENGVRVRGSLAWQRARADDGSPLSNAPRRLGALVFSAPLGGGWTVAGQWQGLSSRLARSSTVGGHGIVNLVFSSRALPGLGAWSVGIHNLGDRRYRDPVSAAHLQDAIAQDGREFRVRWTLAL